MFAHRGSAQHYARVYPCTVEQQRATGPRQGHLDGVEKRALLHLALPAGAGHGGAARQHGGARGNVPIRLRGSIAEVHIPTASMPSSPPSTLPQATPPDQRRILFLDFDGVLHPQHEARHHPFGYMDNFCGLMRDADPLGAVSIVISSSWRLLYPLDELRAHFPQDIAARIIDVTPFLLPVNRELKGSREREIMDWMAGHAAEGAWLAVDDVAMYFEDGCPHLFLVDEDFPVVHTAVDGNFSLMEEIEERERLTALWRSQGLGINDRVAAALRRRMLEFLGRG